MPVRFFLEGYLGNLERTMQRPPNFNPRGGGRTKGYKYTAADCDCRFCTNAPKPRTSCGISMTECPCLTERLESGCVTASDLIASLFPDIRFPKLRQRVGELISERTANDIFFASTHHQALFNGVIRDGGLRHSSDTGLLAALFLLTSNGFLWNRARFAIWRSRIAFEDISIRGITEAKIDNYAIYKAAKELCADNGGCHICPQELADETLVGEKAFRLIVNAMLIKRYGLAAVKAGSDIFS